MTLFDEVTLPQNILILKSCKNMSNKLPKWGMLKKQFKKFGRNFKDGGWNYHIQNKGLDCFTSFLNRQQRYRCQLTVIALWQAYQAIAASWHLHFCCMLRKEVQQSSPLYFIWHFQPPPKDTIPFIFFLHNKFAFGEFIYVDSVVSNVCFVKCSQIMNFTLEITL